MKQSDISSSSVKAVTRKALADAKGPLYVSISDLLRGEILGGTLRPGTRLPTIEQLATDFGVARVTLRQALAVLSDEGLITSIQGRGTFVADASKANQHVRLESDWKQLLGALEGNVPAPIEIIDHVTELPSLPEEGVSTLNYRYMRRKHVSNDQPYCLIEIFLDREVYQKDPEIFDTQMVIPHLRRVTGIKPRRMRQTFQIGSANYETALALGINLNSPIGIVRRIVSDERNRILYLGKGFYRGDLVVFETTIDVPE